jgi:hypothetical protein
LITDIKQLNNIYLTTPKNNIKKLGSPINQIWKLIAITPGFVLSRTLENLRITLFADCVQKK